MRRGRSTIRVKKVRIAKRQGIIMEPMRSMLQRRPNIILRPQITLIMVMTTNTTMDLIQVRITTSMASRDRAHNIRRPVDRQIFQAVCLDKRSSTEKEMQHREFEHHLDKRTCHEARPAGL